MTIALDQRYMTRIGASFLTPERIAGLQLWYDARTPMGLANDDPMVIWPDSSGNGNHATLGVAPTFRTADLNSGPATQNDGTNYMLSGVTPTATATIVAVIGSTTTSRVVFGAQTTAPNARSYLALAAGGEVGGGVGTQGLDVILGSTAINDDAPHILVLTYNGTTVTLNADGAKEYSAAQVGSAPTNEWYVHAIHKDATISNVFIGDIGQILVYNRVVSDKEKTDLAEYFGNIYGITLLFMMDRAGRVMRDRFGAGIEAR